MGFLDGTVVKNPPARAGGMGSIPGEGNGNPLQYSCLGNPMDGGACWTAVHGVAKSRTRLSNFPFTFTFMHWRRKWQPAPVFLPGEPRDGGAWWAAIYGAAQSRTRLKRRSSSSILGKSIKLLVLPPMEIGLGKRGEGVQSP